MFFNNIFRERALLRRQRQEPLDDRLQITAPHEWLLVTGLGVMFVALLVFGVVGSVERSLSYDAVLVRPGERHTVVAPVTGTVMEVLTEVGATVEPGQTIARVQTPADQQWKSAARRLTELLREDARGAAGASAELLQLLASVTDVGTVGGDIVSLFGGEVVMIDLAPGRPVTAGAPVALVWTATPGPPEVLALAPPDEASRLEAGMAAQVRLAGDGRGAGMLQAQVADVSERPVTPPAWLTALGLSASEGFHQVRVSLVSDDPGPVVADGAIGSLRVVLGRSSFVELLAPGSRD